MTMPGIPPSTDPILVILISYLVWILSSIGIGLLCAYFVRKLQISRTKKLLLLIPGSIMFGLLVTYIVFIFNLRYI